MLSLKKIITVSILMLILMCSSLFAITIDQIIDKHAEAIGGMEKLRNFKSVHSVLTVEMGGMMGTAEMYYEKPDKALVIMDLSMIQMEQGMYEGRCWIKDQTGTLRDMAGSELSQFITDNYISSFDYILDAELRQYMTYQGEEQFEQYNCYKVLFNPPLGEKYTMFIDKETFLMVGGNLSVMGLPVKVIYSDWRIADGYKVPFKIVQDLGNPLLLTTMQTTGIEVNVELADALFKPPTEAPASHGFADSVGMAMVNIEIGVNLVYISATVNGVGPFHFLLDTGAGMTIVDKQLADSLGLQEAGTLPAAGIGGLDVGKFARVDSIGFTDLSLYDLTVGVMDFTEINKFTAIPINGIIGYNLFSRLIVEIDYSGGKLNVYPPESKLFSGGADTLECEIESNHPIVKGLVNDSIEGRFRFDTGSQNFLDLNTPFVRNNNIKDDVLKELGEYEIMGVGGSSKTSLVFIKSLTFGKTRLPEIMTGLYEAETGIFSTENVDGNVGGGVLGWFKVAFDYPHNKVYMTLQEEPEINQGPFISGILLESDERGITIMRLIPGTPAEESELQIGDRLLRVNGEEVDSLELNDIYDKFEESSGKVLQLEVMRDGVSLRVELKLEDGE